MNAHAVVACPVCACALTTEDIRRGECPHCGWAVYVIRREDREPAREPYPGELLVLAGLLTLVGRLYGALEWWQHRTRGRR